MSGFCFVLLLQRGRDSNPRNSFPFTHFPGVLLQPLGHLSVYYGAANISAKAQNHPLNKAVALAVVMLASSATVIPLAPASASAICRR
ncbi:MAG: hypothetical protein RL135_643 [Bacteroidota bacterium]|jgi:hypothetical protein